MTSKVEDEISPITEMMLPLKLNDKVDENCNKTTSEAEDLSPAVDDSDRANKISPQNTSSQKSATPVVLKSRQKIRNSPKTIGKNTSELQVRKQHSVDSDLIQIDSESDSDEKPPVQLLQAYSLANCSSNDQSTPPVNKQTGLMNLNPVVNKRMGMEFEKDCLNSSVESGSNTDSPDKVVPNSMKNNAKNNTKDVDMDCIIIID